MTTQEILHAAKAAAPSLLTLTTDRKNAALCAMADALERNMPSILAENEKDMEAAKGSISTVMLDRLRLTPERVKGMADGIREVAALPDPVRVLERIERPNGLVIEKTAVPMGVIAIIYESRPNVTSDAAALAVKAGSACVLRGGKEAFRSGFAIVKALREGLKAVGLPETVVSLVEDTTRESSYELMRAVGLVDLLIPRGGAGLIRACVDRQRSPVSRPEPVSVISMSMTVPTLHRRSISSRTQKPPGLRSAMQRKCCWCTVQLPNSSCRC